MSDTPVPQGTDTPSVPAVPAVAAPVIPPAPPAVPKVDMTPAQLKERLDEERTKAAQRAQEALAKDLGIPLDEAKKLIAEHKERENATKSEVQKLADQKAALERQLSEFAAYKSAVESRAAYEFSALTDAQKAAVEKAAGDSPAKRLEIIDAFRPTWAAADKIAQEAADLKAAAEKAAAEEAKKAAPPPKIPAGASTTPATPPPPPTQPGTPTNHLAVWEDLKTRNPAMAALYRVKHDAAIRAAQRQATG